MQPGLQPDVSMYSTVSGKHIDSLRIQEGPLPCLDAEWRGRRDECESCGIPPK